MRLKKESEQNIVDNQPPKEVDASKLKRVLQSQKSEYYKYTDSLKKFSFQYFSEMFRNKFQKKKTYLIFMQMRNGKIFQFKVSTFLRYFEAFEGCYYIDPDMVREDVHSGINTLYYHQDIAIPFKLDFDIDKIRQIIKDNEISDKENKVEKAINPTSLKAFIKSEIIEKIFKGEEITKELKFIKIIVIIILIIQVIQFLLFAKSQGWF